jgi:hypothetical protein
MRCRDDGLIRRAERWQFYLGTDFLSDFGNGAINAPLYVTSPAGSSCRTALAPYAAWSSLFERAIAAYGWRQTMVGFGVLAAVLIVPLAALASPPPRLRHQTATGRVDNPTECSTPPIVFALLAVASFLCCVPMAMPTAHLTAL